MINQTELVEMAKGFSGLAKEINESPENLQDFKDAYPEILAQITETLKIVEDVLDDKPNVMLDEISRASIKAQLENPIQEYNKKEHKAALKYIFSIVKAGDKEVGEVIFSH